MSMLSEEYKYRYVSKPFSFFQYGQIYGMIFFKKQENST
ncbi:hypothetical protein FM120_17245 [Sphingobacterium faecium PCAi_F2.5]|nr:hypothetical protein FM120_17245 [Sphingobacterium faecium PCAi_F2.5]